MSGDLEKAAARSDIADEVMAPIVRAVMNPARKAMPRLPPIPVQRASVRDVDQARVRGSNLRGTAPSAEEQTDSKSPTAPAERHQGQMLESD